MNGLIAHNLFYTCRVWDIRCLVRIMLRNVVIAAFFFIFGAVMGFIFAVMFLMNNKD